MSAHEFAESVVRMCRERPDDVRVRVRINGKNWIALTGSEFLKLWTQPFAGTIEVDSACRLGSRTGSQGTD